MDQRSDKKQLFQKYLNNQCTAAELEEVWTYIHADQIPAEFEEVIRENLEQKIADQPSVTPEISGRMLKNIQARTSTSGNKSKLVKLPLQRRAMAIAASIILILMSGLWYFYFSGALLQSSHQVYATNYGETRQILLPDSSSVVLNANSRLTVSSGWEAALDEEEPFVRDVWLEGEAIFDVKRLSQPTRFVVHTNDLKVEVLGTRFDVNSRKQKTRVVLDEGKVKLLAHNQPELIMNPGELVELSKDKAQFQKKTVNPETYMSWRHDELIFEATPLIEIIDILENNYGYQVIIRNASVHQNMLFTGTVPANDTALLLQMLSESFGISIRQQDKKIVFQ